MFHHKKVCTGKRTKKLVTQIQDCLHDPGKQEQNAAGRSDHDLGQAQSQRQEEVGRIAFAVPGAHPGLYKHRTSFGDKTIEILEFLETAEMGEGSSREHAQGWLDYHHRKGGRSAAVLPKDIRTCWQHVAKVLKNNTDIFCPYQVALMSFVALTRIALSVRSRVAFALGLRAVRRPLGDGQTTQGLTT